jgi:hypothetical protein
MQGLYDLTEGREGKRFQYFLPEEVKTLIRNVDDDDN